MNTIFYRIILTFCFILALTLPGWADTKTAMLKDIMFDTPSNEIEQVTFKLSSKHLPKIFAIKGDKPRLVFDFPNTKATAALNNIINTNGKLIIKIRIGNHEGTTPKTRVVLDLSPDLELGFKQKFNAKKQSLVVSVEPVPKPHALKKQATQQSTPTNTKKLTPKQSVTSANANVKKTTPPVTPVTQPPKEVTDKPPANQETVTTQEKVTLNQSPILESIKFDGGSDRGEMILFKLNDFYPPIVFGLEENLPRVVCDFMNTKAAKAVPNVVKCDGKFIKTVRVGRHANPDKVRVVLDLTPNNNYDPNRFSLKKTICSLSSLIL
ncbi:MAG: AMIN domain-containing protein [Desulfobulbaceae bacterium]|nr:AMIN domain-containing protein [Desulfobulbaceae bacterium]